MEETQAIDFADFPLEDDFAPAADIGTDQVRRSPTEESFGRSRFTVPCSRICWLFQVVGALEVASQPADSFPLHLGELRFIVFKCLSMHHSASQKLASNHALFLVKLVLLPTGLNVVGRGSSNQADHQGLLGKWKGEHPGIPVHGKCFAQKSDVPICQRACDKHLWRCRHFPPEQQHLFLTCCHM